MSVACVVYRFALEMHGMLDRPEVQGSLAATEATRQVHDELCGG
jgi:hypothetical protein